MEVQPTAFRAETLTLTLITLTSNLDLQSHESYGHDPYTYPKVQGRKSLGSKVENIRTDGRTKASTLPPVLTQWILNMAVLLMHRHEECRLEK